MKVCDFLICIKYELFKKIKKNSDQAAVSQFVKDLEIKTFYNNFMQAVFIMVLHVFLKSHHEYKFVFYFSFLAT